MKPVLKLFTLFIAISLIFLLSFLLFQENFEILFNFHACHQWFMTIKPYAWLIGILLLLADLIMPVPATGVLASLGAVYGVLPGALFGTIGSAGAGMLGYGAARLLGPKVTQLIATRKEREKFKVFFDQWGGYAIIISRILPLLPEVLTILAGISGMKFSKFILALLAGTIPVCFLFAWIGHFSEDTPVFGLLISVLIPVLLWPLFTKRLKS
ncbi:MAG: VTT domain-containing protein [Pseudomonadota bacterium]